MRSGRQGSRRLALVALAFLLLGAAPAAAAEPVFEKYKVATVGGAEINVEVMRPAGAADAPVILTYSPYNTLSEGTTPNLANDDLGKRYVERGYARAIADVIGTRGSSGCWDYGGAKEQQSGVDVVNFLAGRDWSNGSVAMIGGSYDGTTANMVAARGDDVPGLKAIVPIAAISRWYGYAYSNGVRYLGNSEVPTDEGFDTPLAFDFGFGRTIPTDPEDPKLIEKVASRTNPCDAAEHTERGYDSTPDYDDFWLERDYRKDAARFRAAVLLAHGWLDWNVKQEEGVALWEALPDTVFKRLYLFQDSHATPSAPNWQPLLDRFFDHTLKGVDNGVDREPPVLTEGRWSGGPESFRAESAWPPAGTRDLTFYLTRGLTGGILAPRSTPAAPATYADSAVVTEELSTQSPKGEGGWLYYESEPVARSTRLAGAPKLHAALTVDRAAGQLDPVLLDVALNGSSTTVSRGFLDLRYRNGLARAAAVPVMDPFTATASLGPQDYVFRKGHRIGLLVQSSNTVWAVPGAPGTRVTLHHGSGVAGASRLTLPVAP